MPELDKVFRGEAPYLEVVNEDRRETSFRKEAIYENERNPILPQLSEELRGLLGLLRGNDETVDGAGDQHFDLSLLSFSIQPGVA